MMKECPYTASSRDVSENTPPSALEISLVRGFCTPRPLGNLLGLGGCIFRYIPPLVSVRTFSHPRQGGIRFNTVRLHCFGVVVGVVGLMGEVEVVRGKLKGNLEGEG